MTPEFKGLTCLYGGVLSRSSLTIELQDVLEPVKHAVIQDAGTRELDPMEPNLYKAGTTSLDMLMTVGTMGKSHLLLVSRADLY